MGKLIRMQAVNYLKYFLPLMIFLIYYFTEYYQGGRRPVFVFLCFWAFLLISGSISTSEGYEEKYKGYRILSILPLSDREIVCTKFLLAAGAVFLATGLNVFLLLVLSGSREPVTTLIMIAVLWGVVCLNYAAVMYIGIFKFGFTRMTSYFWAAFLVLIIVIIFILEDFLLPGLKTWVRAAMKFAAGGLWIPAAFAGIALYMVLYRVALRVKAVSEEV